MLRFRYPMMAVFLALAGTASAQEPTCYSKIEQRALLSRNEVIPLAQAMRGLTVAQKEEVLRARLCQGARGEPVYVLTLLPHSGKVTRATIDASNGNVINGR
jgi:uncharacterized membrane protein YkoI